MKLLPAKLNRLDRILMLCAIILDDNNLDITSEALRSLSGYSIPSVKRGLKSLVEKKYLTRNIRRDNGRYVGVNYTIRRRENARQI